MARIAMFLARSPGPPMTGRKAVIHTAIGALQREHAVDLYVLATRDAGAASCGSAFWLGTVSRARMLCNVAASVLVGRHSLNEALFRCPRRLAFARSLGQDYDFAVADTIRAAPYAQALGVPWHLDLDDLFSARYERYLGQADGLSADLLLGYYRESVPRAARALPRPVLARLLGREARRLKQREIYWAGKATTVSLVSPDEAERFSKTIARPVLSLPMGIPLPPRRWTPGEAHHARAVFLGGLDYKPNLDALRFYQEAVFPLLQSSGTPAPMLYHIGTAPAAVRSRFSPAAIRFEGYVPDVMPQLRAAQFFLAPIVSGSGIKTKVLEAMALGMPVLATPEALSGLKVTHKRECFVCDHPRRFAEGLRYLVDPHAAERLGFNARKYVARNFSIEALAQRWRGVVEQLSSASGARRA